MRLYDDGDPGHGGCWMPWLWLGLTGLAAAVFWTACLPTVPTHLADVRSTHDVVRLDWMLLATFLGFLIWYAARASCMVGVVAWLLLSAQVVGVADEAVNRLHLTGLAPQSGDLLYVLAGVQVLFFTMMFALGVRAHFVERRWARVVRALGSPLYAPGRADH